MEPNADWEIVCPGQIALPTTKYTISHSLETNTYLVLWGDRVIGETMLLSYAKHLARRHMQDMLAMGYEP